MNTLAVRTDACTSESMPGACGFCSGWSLLVEDPTRGKEGGDMEQGVRLLTSAAL